jgi:invasion protein IalB
MRRMMTSSSVLFCAGILGAIIFIGIGLPAAAQPPKSAVPAPATRPEPPRPVDAEPNSTLASFGDWTLRCQRLGNGAEIQRVCEVAQQIHAQDQQSPVAERAYG